MISENNWRDNTGFHRNRAAGGELDLYLLKTIYTSSVARKTEHDTRYRASLFFRNPNNFEASIVAPFMFLTYLRSLGERVIVLCAHPRHVGTTALHHDQITFKQRHKTQLQIQVDVYSILDETGQGIEFFLEND